MLERLKAMAVDGKIKATDVRRRDHRLYKALLARYGSVKAAVEAMGGEGR